MHKKRERCYIGFVSPVSEEQRCTERREGEDSVGGGVGRATGGRYKERDGQKNKHSREKTEEAEKISNVKGLNNKHP